MALSDPTMSDVQQQEPRDPPSDVITLQTLGRPFHLGTLYNQRNDQLVLGLTLWDSEELKENVITTKLPNTEYNVITEDTASSKSAALDINGSLKLSMMAGKVSAGGSAKYINDKKKSNKIARVTLNYKCTTRCDELSMKHLLEKNITYPEILNKCGATHVVVGIVYGSTAYFVFEREVSKNEDITNITGELEANIKSISLGGNASLDITEKEKDEKKKLSCKFHGDYNLKINPSTFGEAVELYRQLPELLGDEYQLAVPVTVYLYPLVNLKSDALRLMHQINYVLINQVEMCFEEFEEIDELCNTLIQWDACVKFEEIRSSLLDFHNHFATYKGHFKHKLSLVLPKISDGMKDQTELLALIEENNQSPFKRKAALKWLNGKERELKILESHLTIFSKATIALKHGDIDCEVIKHNGVCFMFKLYSGKEEYLEIIAEYVKILLEQPDSNTFPKREMQEGNQWFENKAIKETINKKAHTFVLYQEEKQENKHFRFVVCAENVFSHEEVGASIWAFNNGVITDEHFDPPVAPTSDKLEHIQPKNKKEMGSEEMSKESHLEVLPDNVVTSDGEEE